MANILRPGSFDSIKDRDVKSYALGRSNIIRGLTAKSRNLYELVAGRSAVTGQPPTTPRNPTGEIGVDYSGPPWGSAYRHTVAHGGTSVKDNDVRTPEWSSSNFNGMYGYIDLQTYAPFYTIDTEIDYRPYQDLGDKSPYARLYLYVKASLFAGSVTTVTVECFDGIEDLGSKRKASFDVSSSTPSWFNTGLWIRTDPSGHMRAQITMQPLAGETEGVIIEQWTLDQIVKRSH